MLKKITSGPPAFTGCDRSLRRSPDRGRARDPACVPACVCVSHRSRGFFRPPRRLHGRTDERAHDSRVALSVRSAVAVSRHSQHNGGPVWQIALAIAHTTISLLFLAPSCATNLASLCGYVPPPPPPRRSPRTTLSFYFFWGWLFVLSLRTPPPSRSLQLSGSYFFFAGL